MKQPVFNNCNFFRWLRLLAGLAVIVQAILAKDILFALAGLLFAGMAIFNIGCCGAGACYMPARRKDDAVKEVTYEEVS
ncbi:MAG: hypothetical protein ABI687_02540 [Flavitalea sp.]